jgi:hypothetical protein
LIDSNSSKSNNAADLTSCLKVTQISIGRFHHFHLARQLERFGLLDRLWTGYPKFKLKDEHGIEPSKISSFPWLHTINMGWPRLPIIGNSTRIHRELNWYAHDTLDQRAAASLRQAGVLIALSSQGERSGRRMQSLGGWHICDRGSSHIRYQNNLLREEYARWKIDYVGIDPRIIAKEEAEYEGADLISVPSRFAAWPMEAAASDFEPKVTRPKGFSTFSLLGTSRSAKEFPTYSRHFLFSSIRANTSKLWGPSTQLFDPFSQNFRRRMFTSLARFRMRCCPSSTATHT